MIQSITYPEHITSWQQDRFGLFIHWGVYSMVAKNEWCMFREKMSELEYQLLIDRFAPDLFDPREWAATARKAGMKYVIFTTKHHDGFCMWDSSHTNYKITNTPYGRDVLREVVDAFRAEGIKIGLYYSISDWTHPDFLITEGSNHVACEMRSAAEIAALSEGRVMATYCRYMRDQVTELLTQFGEIIELWFDVSGEICPELCESQKMLDLVRSLQPNIILNNRLNLPGSEDILTPENYLRDADCFDKEGQSFPWEGCQTLSAAWCYNRDELSYSKSAARCLEILIAQTSLNGNTLLNIGPTSRGSICPEEQAKLDFIAQWMKFNSRSIYGCGAAPSEIPAPPQNCYYTYNKTTNRLYVHLLAWPCISHLALRGLAGKIVYAQTLHDGARVEILKEAEKVSNENLNPRFSLDAACLRLMSEPEGMPVPVIECFL
ncbi:MAG: alpha-L-fucosidase [Terrimicrobiaceae bacterium]